MTPSDDPLDDPGEGMPASPARRRLAIAVGVAMLLLILGALVWFSVTNTETRDEQGPLLGSTSQPGYARA